MFSTFLGALLSITGAVWFLAVSLRSFQTASNSLEKIYMSVDCLAAIVAFLGGLVLITLGTTSRLNAKRKKAASVNNIDSLLEKISKLESEIQELKQPR